jgi:hypothetical protein
MKSAAVIVGLLLVFLIGIAVGAHLTDDVRSFVEQALVPGLATLAAAFFGAKYAFDLQNTEAKREVESAQIAAGNRVIFALIRKYNKLLNFDSQFLSHLRGDRTAFLQMPPLLELMKDEISIDLESISYLLETDHQNLLGELSVGIAKYQSAIDAINARSRLHLKEAQPAIEKSELVKGGDYSFANIECALGPRLSTTLKQATDQVFEHTRETIRFLADVSGKLTAALKDRFPGKPIIALASVADLKGEDNNGLRDDGPVSPGRA